MKKMLMLLLLAVVVIAVVFVFPISQFSVFYAFEKHLSNFLCHGNIQKTFFNFNLIQLIEKLELFECKPLLCKLGIKMDY